MAENYDISRNAAFKQTHIVTDKLEEYERILKLREKKKQISIVLKSAPKEIREKIEEIF